MKLETGSLGAGFRLAHYTDTWTYHQHRESRLATHTPHPPRHWPKPPTHSPPTPPTPPQPKHRHISHFLHVPPELVKPKTQSCHPESKTPHYNKHLHQISPRCLTHYTIRHRGQLNTHYHQTTYPSSPRLTYDMTTDYNKTDGHSPTTRNLTGHNLRKSFRSDHHTHQYTHCQHNFHKHHTDGRQSQHTKGQDA